jgi:hypothetical protein
MRIAKVLGMLWQVWEIKSCTPSYTVGRGTERVWEHRVGGGTGEVDGSSSKVKCCVADVHVRYTCKE